jgi:hypothetical protein
MNMPTSFSAIAAANASVRQIGGRFSLRHKFRCAPESTVMVVTAGPYHDTSDTKSTSEQYLREL